MTLAAHFRPAQRAHALTYDLALVLGGSILIALSAQLALPIPFSPVPVTGQTFAVVFLGALFGGVRGASAVLAYLAEGVAGFPVFSSGGAGFAHLAGPTGGYLVGFVGAAYLTGHLAERGWNARVWRVATAMVLGNVVIYAFGATWLAAFVGAGPALALGVVPFLAGDALKTALAAAALPVVTRSIANKSA
jgi:biotin transport system substrate-specific component